MEKGPSPVANSYQTPNTSQLFTGSQTVGDKSHCQKGNSPDLQLRSQSVSEVVKDVLLLRQPGCWLRSSHSFKECVIAHWSSDGAPKITGAKTYHRSSGFNIFIY